MKRKTKNLSSPARHDSSPSVQEIQNALAYRFKFEQLIASISTQFISVRVDQIHSTIENAFAEICLFAEIDRGYIFWYSDVLGRHMEKIHEWCGDQIPSELARVRELHMANFPYFDKKIKNLEPFLACNVDRLPPEAESERIEFSAQKVLSLIFVPMIYEGKAIGFVGFETLRRRENWSEDTVSLLKLVNQIFVNALERIRADKILRQSEERYTLIARGVNDGLWDWNLRTNEIFFSPRWKSMLGYTNLELQDSPQEWFKRIHQEDRKQVAHKLQEHLAGKSAHFESEHRVQHKDGSFRWMLTRGLAVKDGRGRIWRIAGSQTDITGRIAFEEKLKHSALHDSLTTLPNRDFFLNRLKASVERAKEEPALLFAVIFMDLDRFKAVNDSFGHLFGDALLIEVSQRIVAAVDSRHLAARLGGDEFTFLLENICDVSEAVQAAESVAQSLNQPFVIQGQTVRISVSIGIALSSSADIRSEFDLLRNADTAMYRAKALRQGRNVVYNETMHAQVVAMLKLETDLRHAVDQQQFEVYYQPIISLETQSIRGFEALVRWNHPEQGMISPAIFIPLAEETGLIIPIGLWVLREACREAARWPKPLSVSVNLSAKQFLDPQLIRTIEKTLEETGLPAERLHLEITESVLVEDTPQAVQVMQWLRELNIKLHLDDFGTGYSSLSYLHRFQMDVLKIDRAFIRNIGKRGENSEIAKTIVSLARTMNMEVVAEGIETSDQLDFLQSLGCEYGQGFYFAKPLSSKAVSSFVWAPKTKSSG